MLYDHSSDSDAGVLTAGQRQRCDTDPTSRWPTAEVVGSSVSAAMRGSGRRDRRSDAVVPQRDCDATEADGDPRAKPI